MPKLGTHGWMQPLWTSCVVLLDSAPCGRGSNVRPRLLLVETAQWETRTHETCRMLTPAPTAADRVMLAEVDRWQEQLAYDLARRKPLLTEAELGRAVRTAIGRVLFLCMAEARGVGNAACWRAFRGFGDPAINEIIGSLSCLPKHCDFSSLPATTLGHVYEHLLGKTIRLTKGREVHIEDKPRVKKANGVYYTPSGLVAHIVQHTVGKLLGGCIVPSRDRNGAVRKPRTDMRGSEWAALRILDPACGAGSFLIGAYQYLLAWYRDHGWRLTLAVKRRILLSNIFGVDIDPQAVEVTKLSLWLAMMEGESTADLPDLANNIQCGNAVIGPDFDERRHPAIKAFDWNAAFPEIMKAGGFDAVIGNPPWGQKAIADDQGIKKYLWNRYR